MHRRASRSRSLARDQAKVWERTHVLPVVTGAQSTVPPGQEQVKPASLRPPLSPLPIGEWATVSIVMEAVPRAPLEDPSLSLARPWRPLSSSPPMSAPTPSSGGRGRAAPHAPRYQPPLHTVH